MTELSVRWTVGCLERNGVGTSRICRLKLITFCAAQSSFNVTQ